MDAYERIPVDDWPALEAWARFQDEDVEVTAETFEREYRGDYRSLADFAFIYAMYEHNLADMLLPFFDVYRYIEWTFGVDVVASKVVRVAHLRSVLLRVTTAPRRWC